MARFKTKLFPGNKLRRLKKGIEDPTPILKQMGLVIVEEAQTAFREQRLGDKVWAKPLTPDLGGIIDDLRKGSSIKPRRFVQADKALVRSSRLMKSIAWRLIGRKAVEAGSNLPYAPTHQFGLKSELEIPTDIHDNLAAFLRKERKRRAGARAELGWMFSLSSITINVRIRPFLGITRRLAERLQIIIRNGLSKATA